MAQQVPESRWPLFRSLGSFRLADLPGDVRPAAANLEDVFVTLARAKQVAA